MRLREQLREERRESVPPTPPLKPWVLTTVPPSSTTTEPSQATTPRSVVNLPGPANFIIHNGSRSAYHRNSAIVPKNSAGTENNLSPNQTCRTPGCVVPVCVRKNGVASRYCSDAHKEYVPHSSWLNEYALNSAEVGKTWLHIMP